MKHVIMLMITIVIGIYGFGQTRHPYYGGGHHTGSHGGHYEGGSGSHHQGGHYVNVRTQNTYGKHKY